LEQKNENVISKRFAGSTGEAATMSRGEKT
jgi:hypothetical protein